MRFLNSFFGGRGCGCGNSCGCEEDCCCGNNSSILFFILVFLVLFAY